MRCVLHINGVEEALNDTARLYRKALWTDAEDYVEICARRMWSRA